MVGGQMAQRPRLTFEQQQVLRQPQRPGCGYADIGSFRECLFREVMEMKLPEERQLLLIQRDELLCVEYFLLQGGRVDGGEGRE